MVAGGMHGYRGHAWLPGVCVVAGGCAWLLGGCVVARGHAWLPGGHVWLLGWHAWLPGGVHRIQRDMVNEQAVHILLECILV